MTAAHATFRTILAILVVVVSVAVLQWLALLHVVEPVSPEQFASVVSLKVVGDWRIGYLHGHHGARLVRTPAASNAATKSAGSDDALVAEMRAVLDSLPRKAALEGGLYSVVLLLAFVALPALARRTAGVAMSAFRRRLLLAGGGALVGIALFSPYQALDYGTSAYTNWVGPGAFSSSGPYITVTGIPGETVSYRTVVEAAAFPGINLASYVLPRQSFEPESEWVLVIKELLPSWLPTPYSLLWKSCVLAPFALFGLLLSFLPFRKKRPVSDSPVPAAPAG